MDLDFELFKKEYEELLKEISDPNLISDWEKFESLSRKKKKLENLIQKIEELENLERQEKENESIISTENDPDFINLAEGELSIIKEKKIEFKKEIRSLIKKINEDKTEKKEGSVIVEIRPGTGGNEAALFAEDLFNMYSRYAQIKGWEFKILDLSKTEIGGYKQIIFQLKNEDAFSHMKNESGVHRVQRVPETEKGGRIHTSTASVAILLKPKRGEIKINPVDLKIDTYKASGPGGQNVNKRETAIRITHLPTGLVVASQNERSLAQNKENAMAILEAKYLEMIEREHEEKIKKERKIQVGKTDRSEKIRTYNYLQDRVTDHRIQKNWHNIENILAGNIDHIIEEVNERIEE